LQFSLKIQRFMYVCLYVCEKIMMTLVVKKMKHFLAKSIKNGDPQ
jgi:hypothetical protein